MRLPLSFVIVAFALMMMTVHGQSLADAAKAEAERRATVAKATKVLTNADLPSVEAITGATTALSVPATSTDTLASSKDPAVVAIVTRIRTKCGKDWPDDFKMRGYCETQQINGLRQISIRNDLGVMKTPEGGIIRTKCSKEWLDDFHMANYCEEQQLKALAQLR
jgi:hypothetical protein